jgi:hypothetical protein
MKVAAWVAAAFIFYMIALTIALTSALGSSQPTGAAQVISVAGIPPEYLILYQQAATQAGIDWAILAGIGEVETDHGRSSAPGVRSGVNSYGCCAGPMQFNIRNGTPSTWDSYGAGGNVYDPADAIPAAARYLVASGAPLDYHRAILAYNHSESYYRDVMDNANRYRAAAKSAPGSSSGTEVGVSDGNWLADLPGSPVQCDRRIIPDVLMLANRFHGHVTACYAATGHKSAGEHPLGLAIDIVPEPPASWGMMMDLARFAGWRPACESTGCASQTHTVFRFVGYNGYPGHGDPEHCGCGSNAHLHLSWNHSEGLPAKSVSVLASD